MTKQEIFDKVWAGLKSQGFQRSQMYNPEDGGLICAYRGFDGLKCAAGWIIPDADYRPEFESKSFGALKINFDYDPAGNERHFVGQLQETHDNGFTPELMEKKLRDLAAQYKLTIPGEV